jgi:hypothetical protein
VTIVLILMVRPLSALAEKASLKLSFNLSFFSEGDLNQWIDSSNSLWVDWGTSRGSQPTGGFESLRFGSLYEIELRFPLDLGFALNLSGSSFHTKKEGNMDLIYQANGENQSASGFIMNDVSAVPLKLGLSYSYPFPMIDNLHLIAQVGRQIIFIKYKNQEIYDEVFRDAGAEFAYTLDRDSSYNSEGLGFYVSLGAEYDLPTFISLVLEVEKVWCRVDGFKGPTTHTENERSPYGEIQDIHSEKASLYFYDSNEWELGNYYSVLTGHRRRPESPYYKDIRQGELNFDSFSLKIGIRIKF